MKYPKITIITPSYNQGDYLEQTITSVLEQQYPNLEYIVMDGGSTDQSVSIIQRYASQLAYWVSEKDKGQTDALNKGFQRSTGEILGWINSDDYLAPGALHRVAEMFMKTSCTVVCGAVTIFDQANQWNYAPAYVSGESLQQTLGKDFYNQPGTFFHRKTLDTIGALDERLHYVMDKEWWIRYLLQYDIHSIAVTTTSLAFHRYHDASKTIAQTDKFMTEYAVILDRLARKAGYSEVAAHLSDYYNVQTHNYTCDYEVMKLQRDHVVQLIGNLILRRFDFTLNEQQYRKGQRLVRLLQHSGYQPDTNCSAILSRLQELTRFPNYFIFRIARRLGLLSNRALYGTGM